MTAAAAAAVAILAARSPIRPPTTHRSIDAVTYARVAGSRPYIERLSFCIPPA